jgi:hypothetical protein
VIVGGAELDRFLHRVGFGGGGRGAIRALATWIESATWIRSTGRSGSTR